MKATRSLLLLLLSIVCIVTVCLRTAFPYEQRRAHNSRSNWQYCKLNADADLVVIATLDSSIEGAPDLYRGDLIELFTEEALTVLVSTFNVAATLKGSTSGKNIEVVHLSWKESVIDLSEMRFAKFEETKTVPVFVSVELDEGTSFSGPTGIRTITPEYLLFLKVRKDGRYELVSSDAQGEASVRILNLWY